jgi:predicted HD superfamily hydrolase involved in NAD metabolism
VHEIFARLVRGIHLTGYPPQDVRTFLERHGFPQTIRHSQQVAEEASKLAFRYGADPRKASRAGWLHDVSVIFLKDQRLETAHALGLQLLLEEERNPVLVHQKISRVMAQEIFLVNDEEILNAIGCHSTLKAGATLLDKAVFVADKLAWDQKGNPPYYAEMAEAIEKSIDKAALVYIRSLYERKDAFPFCLHPWLEAAYYELCGTAPKR